MASADTMFVRDPEEPSLSRVEKSAKMDVGLTALNYVHSMASKLWTPNGPSRNNSEEDRPQPEPDSQRRPTTNKRITPVQLAGKSPDATNTEFQLRQPFSQETSTLRGSLQAHLFGAGRGSVGVSGDRGKRRAQLQSLPRKPPDIQNFDQFPPIGTPEPARAALNPFAVPTEECTFDSKFERRRLCKQIQFGNEIPPGFDIPSIDTESPVTKASTDKKSRTAELFEELSSDQTETLNQLAESYSASLDSNVCRSVLAELNFLFQLLVSNKDEDNEVVITSPAKPVFAKVAERAYFVSKVLELQLSSLLPFISSDLSQMLIDFYPHRLPKPLRKRIERTVEQGIRGEAALRSQLEQKALSSGSNEYVLFQSETDGRNNFPNQMDCIDFGKQRDLFYAVKESWASKQSVPQGVPLSPMPAYNNYDPAYGKLKQLFQLNSSPTNLSRLASLFLSQCVQGARTAARDLNDGTDENIRRILQANPSKFDQLRQRLSAPNNAAFPSTGIVDPMAFLKYFVGISNSAPFNQHLIDRALFELSQAESLAERENAGDSLEALNRIKKSRLLAQLCGYVYFLPYRPEGQGQSTGKASSSMSAEVHLQAQVSLRTYQDTPIDFVSVLVKSLIENRLVVTLPWVLEFLAQADPVTFHLPKFRPVLSLISSIYRQALTTKEPSQTLTQLCQENRTFLRFFCGKLFGLPEFPDKFLFEAEGVKLQDFLPNQDSRRVSSEDRTGFLDAQTFLGSTLIPLWFRTEMKEMLKVLSSSATVKGSIPVPGTVRPARPISKPVLPPPKSKCRIQADLEAQFFALHPVSMRKSVEFISERVASNFVKRLRNEVLLKQRMDLNGKGLFEERAAEACKVHIWQESLGYFPKKCEESVQLLIGDSVSEGVLEMCKEITKKNACHKIRKWVEQYVNKDLFPTSAESLPAAAAESEERVKSATEPKSTWKLFEILAILKKSAQHLHSGSPPVDPVRIDLILEDPRVLEQDPWIHQNVVDLGVLLLACEPSIMSEPERQIKFVDFCKKVNLPLAANILSPRNLSLMAESKDPRLTWRNLGCLVKRLIREGSVTIEEFQDASMLLLREELSDPTSSSVSEFLKDVLASVSNVGSSQEAQVLDWIGWYCSARDDEDF